jgi:hypothetical protein
VEVKLGNLYFAKRHGSDDQGVNSLVDLREKESVVLKNTQTALKRETPYAMSGVQVGPSGKRQAMMSSKR